MRDITISSNNRILINNNASEMADAQSTSNLRLVGNGNPVFIFIMSQNEPSYRKKQISKNRMGFEICAGPHPK
jgi:hypothetical protein